MSDPEIQRVLEFWFCDSELDVPRIDSRMDRWFSTDADLDQQISDAFGDLVERASNGDLSHWQETPEGRLALIILLDQFRRHIYRGQPEAFSKDPMALKLCVEGTMKQDYKSLSPIQQIFFFIPLQHAESVKVQEKSVRIYTALAEGVSDTLRETFLTTAHFAELHRDIVAQVKRFPHRNRLLGRENTPAEETYLAGESPAFGQ